MNDMIKEMLESFENPAMRHAAMVHLPIALAMIGVLFAMLSALASKSRTMRAISVAMYLALAASAWMASMSGEDAQAQMKRNQAGAAFDIVDEHEDMAKRIWALGLVTGGLLLLSAIPAGLFRHGGAWLGVLSGVFTAGYVAVAAHHGGKAVYEYGVGTPNPVTFTDTMQDSNESSSNETSDDKEASIGASAALLAGLNEHEAFFVTHVLPILESSCQRCHNPQRSRRSGALDLSTRALALSGGHSGPALVPGNPDDSVLIMRVSSSDDEVRMPPNEPLSDEEIAALKKWIADGAVWVHVDAEPASP